MSAPLLLRLLARRLGRVLAWVRRVGPRWLAPLFCCVVCCCVWRAAAWRGVLLCWLRVRCAAVCDVLLRGVLCDVLLCGVLLCGVCIQCKRSVWSVVLLRGVLLRGVLMFFYGVLLRGAAV